MNGYHYTYEIDKDEDVRKIFHTVIYPDGSRKNIPWSPYEYMDSDDFQLWIHLGMPTVPLTGSNFTKQSLIEYLNDVMSK
jgi:hypothetical protein